MRTNKIYFDNASTTRPFGRVLEAYNNCSLENYGNPSSLHGLGLSAEKTITSCKKAILNEINGEGELIFTSGASESNNLALMGYVRPYKNKKLITSRIEHPSVLECARELEFRGQQVVYLPSGEYGEIDKEALYGALDENTALVSLHFVNSETGFIQDIAEIGKKIKQLCPSAVFHADAAQGFGKLPIDARKWGVDLLSLSAHKIHGPKGVGALFIRKGVVVQPLFYGGGQQKNIRSGTENVPGICALEAALGLAAQKMAENLDLVSEINNLIRRKIIEIDGAFVNSGPNASPFILNISLTGARSEVMLRALEEHGIYVSAGSACSSRSKTGVVLSACGLSRERVESSLRLSFSCENTVAEAEEFISAAAELLPALRIMKKK